MNKCKINNNSDLEIDKEIYSLVGFTQDRFKFKNPPTIFLNHDEPNSQKTLAKTGYYDPETMEIHIYVTGRHPKDILRSIAHELIHHFQNEKGELTDAGYSGKGYAQKNSHLRKMELQANDPMLFRDWEDSLKENQPTIYNEWRNKNMSIKQWKNQELNKLLLEKFGLKKEYYGKGKGHKYPGQEDEKSEKEEKKDELEELELRKKVKDPEGGLHGVGEKGKAKDGHPGSTKLNISRDKKVRDKYNKGEVDVDDPTFEEKELDETCGDMPPEEDTGPVGVAGDVEGLASRAMAAIHDLAIAAGADMATTVATGEEAEEMDVPVSHIHEEEEIEETTKEWKNKELSENLNKKWGFSMDLTKLKK